MKGETLVKFLTAGQPESSKRLIAYRCAMAMILVTVALGLTICFQGVWYVVAKDGKPIDNGLLTTFPICVGIVSYLAKQIYQKPDQAPVEDSSERTP